MKQIWCGLVVCLLVQAGLVEVCDWEQITDPGQAWDAEVLQECQKDCCAMADCRLVVLSMTGDGEQTCQKCPNRGDCNLQSSEQLTIYRRKIKEEVNYVVPLAAWEPRDDANTIRCRQPMKVGPCKASFPKYYYNNGSCELFIYGGCGGNGNNFDTEAECQAACIGVTGSEVPDNSTPAAAPRGRMMPAQDQNPELNKEAEAEPTTPDSEPAEENATTETVPAEETVSPTPPAPRPEMSAADFAERCEAPVKVGLCRASFPRWYYDSTTRTCQSFTYGGCQGNKNNYNTMESCMATCSVTVVPSNRRGPAETPGPAPNTPSPAPEDKLSRDYKEHCTVASDPGPCRAAFPMFFFESSTETCKPFIYGGCKGNNNRYGSMAECMARCTGSEGRFDERGHGQARDRWTPAFFLVGTLAVISALLLTALVLITLRRNRLPRRSSSVSDKEELLPDPDEQSSVDSLPVPESPTADKA